MGLEDTEANKDSSQAGEIRGFHQISQIRNGWKERNRMIFKAFSTVGT